MAETEEVPGNLEQKGDQQAVSIVQAIQDGMLLFTNQVSDILNSKLDEIKKETN